jgi:hypothetical protein
MKGRTSARSGELSALIATMSEPVRQTQSDVWWVPNREARKRTGYANRNGS